MGSLLDSIGQATNIFDTMASATQQQAQTNEMAGSALAGAIDQYMAGEYEAAVKEFRRAISLSPHGENALSATEYLSITYQKLGEPDLAIKAYEDAVSLRPTRDDIKIKLGNLYFGQGRYQEAEDQYANAVQLNKTAANLFTLGQGLMANGKLSEAEYQFQEAIRFSGGDGQGYYGLGQVLNKAGRYDEAVSAFKRAIESKEDFFDAHVELGYTYANMGEIDKAEEVQSYLKKNAPAHAATLAAHIYKKTSPKIEIALSSSTFMYQLQPKTPVAALHSYLQVAGNSKTFEMDFMFGKKMDAESVRNRYNWSIRRSDFTGPAERYNNGLSIPDTEVSVPAFPERVAYDPDTLRATVTFRISQLPDSTNGTIDPSHLVFKFKGKDADGNAMDPNGDEFSYATGIR